MRRCRRSARRFAPLLALASAGDPRRRRPGSAALGGGDGLLCGGIKKGPHIGGLGLLVYTHIYHVSAVFFQRIRLKHNCSRKIVEVLDVLPQSTR